jgi:RimJ/RimL family protein N-acetyltransferase
MLLSPTPAWRSGLIALFPLLPEHASGDYVAWLNNPAINRYLETRFDTHDVESVRDYIAGCNDQPGTLLLGIARQPDGRHVGNIKLEITRGHGLAEVGILIGDVDVHGKGIGSEAIRLVAGIARDELGLRKLSAGCYASNRGSERAFVKAGFAVEGRRPAHFLLDGEPEDLTLMGLLL